MNDVQRLLAELKWIAGLMETIEAPWLKPKTIASRHDLMISRAKLCLFAYDSSTVEDKES